MIHALCGTAWLSFRILVVYGIVVGQHIPEIFDLAHITHVIKVKH